MMENVWLSISVVMVLIGFFGSFLPVLPGAPVIFGGYLLWGIASGWADYSVTTVIIVGIVAALLFASDYYAGAIGAKKYGASKWAVLFAVAGGIFGLIFLSVPGLIIGPLVGAVAGELLIGKSRQEALRAGWGTFLGIVLGNLLKFAAATVLAALFFYFIII